MVRIYKYLTFRFCSLTVIVTMSQTDWAILKVQEGTSDLIVTIFMTTCPDRDAADTVSNLQLPHNVSPMRSTAVRTGSSPVVFSRLVWTFLAWLCAVGRAAVIWRPADRWTFVHLLVSPLASPPHSSGSVRLSDSHRGFITSPSLIIHVQFKGSSGGVLGDAQWKI